MLERNSPLQEHCHSPTLTPHNWDAPPAHLRLGANLIERPVIDLALGAIAIAFFSTSLSATLTSITLLYLIARVIGIMWERAWLPMVMVPSPWNACLTVRSGETRPCLWTTVDKTVDDKTQEIAILLSTHDIPSIMDHSRKLKTDIVHLNMSPNLFPRRSTDRVNHQVNMTFETIDLFHACTLTGYPLENIKIYGHFNGETPDWFKSIQETHFPDAKVYQSTQ